MVHQHVLWCFIIRIGISYLLRHPVAAGVVGSPAHHKRAALVVDDVQDVKQFATPIKGHLKVLDSTGRRNKLAESFSRRFVV